MSAFDEVRLDLPLDELPAVFAGRWFWSASRAALARFRREDHLGDPGTPLADSVRALKAAGYRVSVDSMQSDELLAAFEAATWEDARRQQHEFLGWDPYRPMED